MGKVQVGEESTSLEDEQTNEDKTEQTTQDALEQTQTARVEDLSEEERAEKERKARDWDLKYMKKFVPDTVFKSFKGMDHGDMALFYPERMAQELLKL